MSAAIRPLTSAALLALALAGCHSRGIWLEQEPELLLGPGVVDCPYYHRGGVDAPAWTEDMSWRLVPPAYFWSAPPLAGEERDATGAEPAQAPGPRRTRDGQIVPAPPAARPTARDPGEPPVPAPVLAR